MGRKSSKIGITSEVRGLGKIRFRLFTISTYTIK
jgi:hypothetical protein